MLKNIKKDYLKHKKSFYRGSDIYCPFCSGSYRPVKNNIGQAGTECPVCGSTIEERTILLFLQSRTEIMSGNLRILIISGEGRLADHFENFPDTEVMIYKETGDFSIRDNRLKSKYTAESFDLIISNYMFEKLPEYISVIKELIRIIKPDGLIMLQANIDENNDKTVELPLTNYKDRLSVYGIRGNYRRFGKDYPSVIKSYGINLSRLRLRSGFESLPELTMDKDDIIHIAHKNEIPLLVDNIDELEEEIEEQRSRAKGNPLSSAMFALLFIFPQFLRKVLISVGSNISERQDNKDNYSYMFYTLFTGLLLFWSSLLFFFFTGRPESSFLMSIHWIVAAPVFILFGFAGLSIMTGYVFLNSEAGIIKKFFVSCCLFLTLWLPFITGLFAM